jgi:hypothetical protein
MPPLYVQSSAPAENQTPGPTPTPRKKKKPGQDDTPTPTPSPTPHIKTPEMYGKAMRDSVISKFLGFNVWADKEQGGWSVQDLPKLYRANVLDPLRATPTADTLAAWDAYIAMANADGTRWSIHPCNLNAPAMTIPSHPTRKNWKGWWV